LKTISNNGAGTLKIIRQEISDAEQAGVREVSLLNLRRLIDQVEQSMSGERVKTPHGTQNGNSQSKSNTGSMNKSKNTNYCGPNCVHRPWRISLSDGERFLSSDPTRGLPILETADPTRAIVSGCRGSCLA